MINYSHTKYFNIKLFIKNKKLVYLLQNFFIKLKYIKILFL